MGTQTCRVFATAAILISGAGEVAIMATSADASVSAVGHYLVTQVGRGSNLPLDVNADGTASLNLTSIGFGVCPGVWTQQGSRFAMSIELNGCTTTLATQSVFLGNVSKNTIATTKRPGSGTQSGLLGTGPFTWYATRQ